jgi:hypothetical protein
MLNLAPGNTNWLDVNAAGWGWFVDETPWDDAESPSPATRANRGAWTC